MQIKAGDLIERAAAPVTPLESEWFAVQVRAGREHLSGQHLQVRGYDVFLPCCRESRRWSDRVKLVERALFDGYVFCCMSDTIVAKVITTPGVIRVVGDGRRPVPIPSEEIAAIQRVVSSGQPVERWPFVQRGQRVCVEAGPLRGLTGLVIRAKGQDRLVVSIALLQRSIAVEIDSGSVRLAPERTDY